MQIKIKKPKISLVVQKFHLKNLFPESRAEIRRSILTWIVDIKPTPLSEMYTILLEYKIGKRPSVFVLKPELELPERRSEVHAFADDSLCLYYPDEWDGEMILAKSIAPWISEWLAFFEIWEITNIWHGGGIHPSN